MKIPKVEYDVYCKLFGTNLIKLNLTVCENSKISLLIPIAITDHPDKFNSSSGYYNDICYTTTSEEGTDISLKDRQKEFIDNNNMVCQEDCDFSEYDYETLLAKCSCKVKESSQSFADMNINKAKLFENFINIQNIINFHFLVCYKKLFTKEGISNNIGCYILLAIILFHIITIFLCKTKVFPFIKKKIKDMVTKFRKLKEKNQENKKERKKENKKENKKVKKKERKIDGSKKYVFELDGIYVFKSSSTNLNALKNSNSIEKSSNTKIPVKGIDMNFNPKYKLHKKDKIEIKTNQKKYIDEEINGLSYYLALQYDKRSYCQYYASLLKTQHSLICALFNTKDYNSRIIKIDLFIIGFAIEYTVNGLFFTDDTMHDIYESKGEFDFLNQLPIIIYSTLISMILNTPLNFLALTNDAIIGFKDINIKNNIKNKAKKLKKILALKFILYYIISCLFYLFFWYYISLFGIIYKNTQMHLLKDTLMSFGLSLLIPFGIYLFPVLFRIPALSTLKNKRECLYNFSKLLQSF